MAGETGQSLGEFLRQEREKRGITIEQVASATKIAVRILHSLEADQYSELPAKPFVRGFVISYVRFIGMDSKEVLTRFGGFIDAKAHDRPTRDQGHSGYAFERRETEQSRMVLWGIMVGFLVVGGVILVVIKPSFHRHRGAHLDKMHASASPSPSPLVSPSLPEGGVAVTPSPSPLVVVASEPSPSPTLSAKEKSALEKAEKEKAAREKAEQEKIEAEKKAAEKKAAEKKAAEEKLAAEKLAAEKKAEEEKLAAQATAAASPAPLPSASPTTSPNDPLNSGADMKKEDIKYRVIFRAVEDVWVRYQSDNRKPMRFILRKDRMLVLRGHDMIRFQASDPKAVRFSYLGQAGKLVAEEKSAVMRQNDLTLFFPAEVAKTIKEPFPGAKPIFMATVPPGARPAASPSPTP